MAKFKIDPKDSGWVPHEKRTAKVKRSYERLMQDAPEFNVIGSEIKGSWDGQTTILLSEIVKKVAGSIPVDIQTIGDCVGHGSARMKVTTLCCDIAIRGENERWPGMNIASEWEYAVGRVIQGGGRISGDGSIGIWMAEAWTENGTLFRQPYEVGGRSYDLTTYSGSRAREWGNRRGFPGELETIADEHPTSGRYVPVLNFDDAADLIANGYAFSVCSNQGFASRRDSDGFLTPSGSWAHCMIGDGVRGGNRPGICLNNKSWQDCFSGPNPDNLESSCGWVDPKTWNRMFAARDSFAAPGFEGFKKAPINWTDF